MTNNLDFFRAKLVIKILYAPSADAVQRFINAGVKWLESNKVNGDSITKFIDKIANQLDVIHAQHGEDVLWANVNTARLLLKSTREQLCGASN